jgi:hypothetical protein
VIPSESEISGEEDEMANAPESGQPFRGRINPWDDDDDEKSAGTHAFPTEHGGAPGDDL